MKSLLTLVLGVFLLDGCGNPLQEAKQSLQGSWMDGRYLDSLSSTGSPYRAAMSFRGISGLRYDATYDSLVVGYFDHEFVELKGLSLVGSDSLRIGGTAGGMTIPSPQWADRMLVQGVELRRVSRVFQLTINEYILREYFHGSYALIDGRGERHKDSVVIQGSGAVKGLGEFTSCAVVTDYKRTQVLGDAAAFESIFLKDTLYYTWTVAGDTLHLQWVPPTDHTGSSPPMPPGPGFTLVKLPR